MDTRLKAILVAAMLLAPTLTLAHDEHEWINNGKYKNQRGEHCCGKGDCERISEQEVFDGGDYFIFKPTNERINRNHAHKSEDGNFHRCFYRSNGVKMTRCFFYPIGGV